MKLIIEIEEKDYNLARDLVRGVEPKFCRYRIYKAIAQSIPYNPSGDSISREALKNDIGIQGEWARHDEWVNGEYVGGFYHVNCPVIEEGYALYSRWETRFCPNCGAPMMKGGTE